ncbi:MAG: apolipoprotein N-acyltransferase [Epsilonproteobacteria bacterium]|nr:MAG: apolipoprotein N-acyltransferase [Campylobacterota bacterium]RLA66728.1 MAG: apolipoprotein N-acyltransferase [Campylobacterota bacterium]
MNLPSFAKIFATPFLGACIYAFGFPLTWSPKFFFTPMIGVAIYLGSLDFESNKLGKNLIKTIMFLLGIYAMGFYWIPYTIKEFGGIPFPINQLLGMFSSILLQPHYLSFVLLIYLFNKFNFHAPEIFKKNQSLKNATLALILTLLEFYTPQQFPAYIGHAWIVLAPYLGLAKIFGQPIFSFFSFWIALVMVTYFKEKKFDILGTVLFISFIIINFIFPLKWNQDSFTKVNNLRLAQANVGNFMKMDSEKGGVTSKVEVERRFISLSTLYSNKPIDLIIWPETSFPKLLYSEKMKTSPYFVPGIFKEIIQSTGAEIFFGSYDYANNNSGSTIESEYNSAFLLGSNALLKDVYHKNRLLPFGEGLPFGPLNKIIAPYLKNIMSFFAKGTKPVLFKTKNNSYFTTAICYEILFSNFIRDYLNSFNTQPDFIINLTNDSWYGITSEPYHHLELSHWRAMELNLPVVRMTNTGISSVLYPDGSESKRTGLFTQEILDVTLKTPNIKKATIFQTWGILALLSLFIPIFGMAFILGRRRSL